MCNYTLFNLRTAFKLHLFVANNLLIPEQSIKKTHILYVAPIFRIYAP